MLKWTKKQQRQQNQQQQEPQIKLKRKQQFEQRLQLYKQQKLKTTRTQSLQTHNSVTLSRNHQQLKPLHKKRYAKEFVSQQMISKKRKQEQYQYIAITGMQQQREQQQHLNLERQLHRRSLDNYLDGLNERRVQNNGDRGRISGDYGGTSGSFFKNANKENVGIYFRRSSLGAANTSLTAFQDLSNGQSPQRNENPITPTRSIRYSDNFNASSNLIEDLTPLRQMKYSNKRMSVMTKVDDWDEDSLTSSRMGDVTLDRMLNAIIESAKKECQSVLVNKIPTVGEEVYDQNNNDYNDDNNNNDSLQVHVNNSSLKIEKVHRENHIDNKKQVNVELEVEDDSIHEMEVRTPQHLKRQRRVVRRKRHTTEKKMQNDLQDYRKMNMIGLTLPNGIPSPETPNYGNKEHIKQTEQQRQHCSTPNISVELESVQNIKRCLNFSCNSDNDNYDTEEHYYTNIKKIQSKSARQTTGLVKEVEEEDDEEYPDEENDHHLSNINNHKRDSVASSLASSISEHLFGGNSSVPVKGSIDVAIYVQEGILNVHVIRCRQLQRNNDLSCSALNAYVKVALICCNQLAKVQRTAVHRNSTRPQFDHHFQFYLSQIFQLTNEIEDEDRLQLAVWHRDRQLKRSEFLGCMSFPLLTLLHQEINGSYKLQSQACLNKPQPAIPLLKAQHILQYHCHQQHKEQEEQSQQKFQSYINQRDVTLHVNNINNNNKNVNNNHNYNYQYNCDKRQQLVLFNNMHRQQKQQEEQPPSQQEHNNIPIPDDDVISIDSMAQPLATGTTQVPMVLSKKALHQRDADENLFLRFLELDPLPSQQQQQQQTQIQSSSSGGGNNDMSAAVAASATVLAQSTPLAGTSDRRISTSKPVGRTPFTMTKKLQRTTERGFGFSIVWTHPPRVEKIEPGLSADRCGILPGDYVIFVDKHNVVTMPEADVLNLIRSQGSTLTLEIFRRSTGSNTIGLGMAAGNFTTAAVITAPSTSTKASASAASNINISGTNLTTSTTIGLTGGDGSNTGTLRSYATTLPMNGKVSRILSGTSCATSEEFLTNNTNSISNVPYVKNIGISGSGGGGGIGGSQPLVARPATACSVATNSSIEAAKRRLHLPQVTFSKESISPITDNRRRFLFQLISREQNFISALHFGVQRFVQPLRERKDLITPNDHRTLFQNIDELLRISEDILEQLCHDDQEPQMNFASRVYLSKTTAICAAYKKYCNGIKRADCVLVNKSRQTGSEFISFITEPPVPRKRPDLTMFIHRPLQHFREILKLMQLLASNCHVDTEEHKNFSTVINELQAAYREITVSSGLMEPLGEGRPLLTLQDLETRMVFTKCKPFILAVQGRQWIFGGDLSRIDGRSIKPYWTLLFSDIIVFAKVSRDRVLFITEEPVPIANIVDSCFHMRKKTTEFRLTVDPNGRLAESPTGYCGPDLTKTPKKGSRRKSLVLRAPSLELKAVWQNLLQRQIFLVNAALGSTPLSSPLDSPDVLNTLVPLSDIGIASTSIGSIKMSSIDSINLKNQQQQFLQHQNYQQHSQQQQQQRQQQQQQQRQQVLSLRSSFSKNITSSGNSNLAAGGSFENLQRLASTLISRSSTHKTPSQLSKHTSISQTNSPASYRRNDNNVLPGDSVTSLRSYLCSKRSHQLHNISASTESSRQVSVAARSSLANSNNNSSNLLTCESGSSLNTQTLGSGDQIPILTSCKCLTSIPEASIETGNDSNYELKAILLRQNCSTANEKVLLIDSNGRCCLTTASVLSLQTSDNNNVRLSSNHNLKNLSSNDKNDNSVCKVGCDTAQKDNRNKKLLEFSLSSVGRSFIDDTSIAPGNDVVLTQSNTITTTSLATPEEPTPNISPTINPTCVTPKSRQYHYHYRHNIKKPSTEQQQSKHIKDNDTFSNDFVPIGQPQQRKFSLYMSSSSSSSLSSPSVFASSSPSSSSSSSASSSKSNSPKNKARSKKEEKLPLIPLAQFGGSWDLLELDLNFHEVNLDTCYDTDVEEHIFHGDKQEFQSVNEDEEDDGNNNDDDDDDIGITEKNIIEQLLLDDPFGVLPTKPTPPDSLDL